MIERARLPDAAGVRSVTVSVGLALLTANDGFDDLFTLADEAMYMGKRSGGNQVNVIAPSVEQRREVT